jgi:hypothetical protein
LEKAMQQHDERIKDIARREGYEKAAAVYEPQFRELANKLKAMEGDVVRNIEGNEGNQAVSKKECEEYKLLCKSCESYIKELQWQVDHNYVPPTYSGTNYTKGLKAELKKRKAELEKLKSLNIA